MILNPLTTPVKRRWRKLRLVKKLNPTSSDHSILKKLPDTYSVTFEAQVVCFSICMTYLQSIFAGICGNNGELWVEVIVTAGMYSCNKIFPAYTFLISFYLPNAIRKSEYVSYALDKKIITLSATK